MNTYFYLSYLYLNVFIFFRIRMDEKLALLTSIVGVIALVVLLAQFIQKFIAYRKWVAIYDAMPGEKEKHWLWGHLHLVRLI